MKYEKNGAGFLVPANAYSRGHWSCALRRNGKIVDEWELDNLIVNEGLNDLLNVYLAAGTQSTTWYVGLFTGNYTPLPTDTAASIASNATECTAYSGGARQAWTPGAVSSQAVDNTASRATFTFTGPATVYGGFLVSSATRGGTSGTLYSAARFSSSKSVDSTYQLLVGIQLTQASA